MKRNLEELTRNNYDLLVIGGGIYGACVAWEASLRGLTVALVEKADFGGATSANSLKIIHGGLRYLQHADLKRMRESIHERTTLMRIAPHLVHPLPILLPLYGHGMKGKEVFSIALALNDLISCDRNFLRDSQKHIPRGKVISAQECQQLLPNIARADLTGGAIFYDAQVYNSERLTLAFLRSAWHSGADIANYVEVQGFVHDGQSIKGVQVKDTLSGEQFEISAKTVVNTSGPWVNRVLSKFNGSVLPAPVNFAKAMNLVLRRQLFDTYAVGLYSQNNFHDPDSIVNKGSRLLFVAPWRGKSIVGTAYSVFDGNPDNWSVSEAEIQEFIDALNQAYPEAKLTREDVALVHSGLLPRTNINDMGEPVLAKQYQIHDHSQDGCEGLFSVVGVKYTTARDVAQKVIDRIFQSWGRKVPPSQSASTSLYGGKIEQFGDFLAQAIDQHAHQVAEPTIQRLVYNYGSEYAQILNYCTNFPDSHPDSAVLQAEVLHAVRQEMAQNLSDVVFRRTELGSAGNPGYEKLKVCAEVMGKELGWTTAKTEQEVQQVNDSFNQSKSLVKV